MIKTVYLLGVFAALFVNISALALLVYRYIPLPATARTLGIVGLCGGLFAVEFYVGLGDLSVAFLPLTAASAYALWRAQQRGADAAFSRSQIVFLAAFIVCLLYRLATPDIVEDNDRLTDIHLVTNYMAGVRLPPPDYWFPAQTVDYYYTFQHYCAALIGRFMKLGPGMAFNIAAVLIASLVITLAWEFLSALRLRLANKLLCTAALVIGGTGVSPFFHFITAPSDNDIFSFGSPKHGFFYNSRFVGWFENATASPLWQTIFGTDTKRAVLLPIETFGYQLPLGGYHAPLSGYLFLFLALAIMVSIPRLPQRHHARLESVLGLTVPLVILSNAWVFPLQAVLVGGWKLWDWSVTDRREFLPIVAGFFLGVVLFMPALAGLTAETGYARIALVPTRAHTPVMQFLLVHWPLIVLAAMLPFAKLSRSLGLFLALLFVCLLLLTEIFNVKDGGYRGDFLRFNPALKWWGWTFTGGVFTASAFLLASGRRAYRAAAAVVLLLTSTFTFDVGRLTVERFASSSLALDGTAHYRADPANARILDYLTAAPFGIVLENVHEERPVDTGVYGSLTRKPSLVGIPWVLGVWRRNLPDLAQIVDEVKQFYAATNADPVRFLTGHNIRYVVWTAREGDDIAAWQTIDAAIARSYRWIEFSTDPERHVGLWVRIFDAQ